MTNPTRFRFAHRSSKTIIASLATALVVASCGTGPLAGSGSVSDAEFRKAAQAAADCIESQGWIADGPQPGAGGIGYTVGVSTEPDTDADAQQEATDALDACWQRHAASTASAFYASLELTGEARESKYEELVGCLEEAGVTGVKVGDPEGVVGSAIGDNPEGVECMQRYLWMVFGDGSAD